MSRYEKYKDSGIEWIGQIPKHWSIERLKTRIYKSFAGIWGDDAQNNVNDVRCYRVADFDYNQLNISDDNPTKRNVEKSIFEQRKVSFDDILLEKSGGGEKSPVGRAVYVNLKEDAICSNFVHCIKVDKTLTSKFLVYVLCDMYNKKVNLLYFNQTTGIQNLNVSDYLNNKIGFPPLTEQQQIADYLDQKCAEVDELIALKQKMIDELKVYKQSVITEAVTKGLNPDAPLKDSGIEWIGQIPQHWKIKRVKDICSSNSSTLSDNTKDDYEFSYVDIGSVNFENGIISSEVFMFKNAPSRARRIAKLNDIVVSTVRTYLRAIDIVDTEEKANYVYSTGFAILSPRKNNLSKFIIYICRSEYFTFQVSLLSNGINYPSINSTNMNCMSVFIPPIDEQQQIADYLDTKCAEIDEMTSIKRQKIEQLKEYKKSIIYEYVTGKKQVNIE